MPILMAMMLSLIVPGFAAPSHATQMVIYVTSPAFLLRQTTASAPIPILANTFELFNVVRLTLLSNALRSLSRLGFGWCLLTNLALDLGILSLRFLF